MPTISIVIPTKDRIDLLACCLQSLLDQTFKDWEAIVCNDGSPSLTANLSTEFLADNRIRMLDGDPARPGASARRNDGLRSAMSDFVIFLDDDDMLSDTCLSDRLAAMASRQELDAVIAQARLFSQTPGDMDTYWNLFTLEDDLTRFLRGDAPWQTSGPLWRRSFLKKLGGWNEAAKRSQDFEFHVRALSAGLRYEKLCVADIWYRFASDGTVSSGGTEPPAAFHMLDVCNGLRSNLTAAGTARPDTLRRITALMRFHLFRITTKPDFAEESKRLLAEARRRNFIGVLDHRLALAGLALRDWPRPFRYLSWRLLCVAFRSRLRQLGGPYRKNSPAPCSDEFLQAKACRG